MQETLSSKKVTLTFDNGPTPGVTDQVLDVLAQHQMSAIFFVVGQNICSPAGHRLIARAVREGHRIGNHSFTHGLPLGELSPEETIHEISSTQKLLDDFTDIDRYFRPWGTEGALERRCLNQTAVDYLIAEKYTCVLWNSIPRDWADPNGWVSRALAHTRNHQHSAVVLHDLPTGAMEHLPRFLDELRILRPRGHHTTSRRLRADRPRSDTNTDQSPHGRGNNRCGSAT